MDKTYLTLVGVQGDPQREEFLPLPFYPWDERPPAVPLDHDECATAVHLSDGDVAAAAQLLKVAGHRLERIIKHSPRLQRVVSESLEGLQRKAVHEYAQALDSEDYRVRWAAAQKVMASKLAQAHPLAPAPPSTAQASSLTVNANKSITFRWRTAADREAEEAAEADNGGDSGPDAA